MRTRLPLLLAAILTPFALAAAASSPPKPAQVIPLDGVEGRIDHMALDEKTNRLFVAALGNNTVEVIDLAARKRVGTIKGLHEPQGIAVVPDSHRILVADGGDATVRIYDADLKPLVKIDNLDDADNARYDPAAKQVIVGYGSGGLAFIDPQALKKTSDIKLDAHPESFQLETTGRRIFVNVPGASEIAVVDRDKAAVVDRWKLADAKANFPMALDETNHRLFVGCRKPATLLVFNTQTAKVVASSKIVDDADDIFYDPARKHIYISGGGGHVTVLEQKDPDTYADAGRIDTAPGARTSFFIPGPALLYVAVPHRQAQPAELQALHVAPDKP